MVPGLLSRARFVRVLLALTAILGFAVLIGLALGPSRISPAEVVRVLSGGASDGATLDIVWRIRMPRTVLAALVGACLSVAGVVFQALLRNPLADPFILGVSGGAALGGIAMLSFAGALGLGYAAVPPAAFAGAVLATLLLYVVAGASGRVSATNLLLTGVVFNAFASAAIVFLASAAGLADGTRIYLWLIGNLSAARVDVAWWLVAFLAIGLGCALVLARSLNLLALGEEVAEQLGVPVASHQRILLLATSLMVGAAVSVAGLVGFVGLIIPHLLRLVLGPDHRLLVPASALGGAAFLVLCDTCARTMLGGRELPVGAVTAVAGGPLFLMLLRRHQLRVLGS
jgi:iron complex transport system permease protein